MDTAGNGAARRAQLTEAAFAELREATVEKQIRKRGITTPRLLDALRKIPRHEFVPEELRALSYEDSPLAIGEGQTISQPFMVAAMTDALELAGEERVLEIGTGSGYQAALLALLAREVHSIERSAALAEIARERLARLGYGNVTVHHRDGTLGLPEFAPFEAILVTAAAPRIPQPLADQLAEGGRMVIPVGEAQQQECLLVRKREGRTTQETLHYCRFVPLVGEHGWDGPSWSDE
ncbi:MAG: protein-L-isoaspartate(D-aspartate) O-methyltransferase [Verrucomicrobiales bacterium]|nr:protein-L-isoaspartate(D-aspartate) O-methyltransferase [Verrucomicrobiales bacterium]